ncbi:MAG: SDR family oxidoreductase [Oscillospiraceae bacterium]|jgi:NAD(P)-dependent dehydrogenase (short-subunit alcohol dehydrogenase family)|nr:SDR family oxidoreductase [Oscillospiraceae bacterium]
MKDFKDKIVFITGGASGAGLGQAQVFKAAGAKVVIADMNRQRLNEAIRNGDADYAIKLDVTDRKAFAQAADEIEKVFGETVDVLILTAGVNTFGPAEASTYDDYDWVVGVCFGGVVNGLVTFVPRIIKKGKGGYIASTVSWGAFGAGPSTAPYSAAKAGVLNLLESYYNALKPYNIGVSAVCPANINSHIYEAALNRPENLQDTGYNVSDKTQNFLASIHKNGLDPKVLANWLKKGMEDEIFLVIPYDQAPRMVEIEMERFRYLAYPGGEADLAALRATPERQAESGRMGAIREGYDVSNTGPIVPPADGEKSDAPPPVFAFPDTGGFGMAKADLDYVDPSKKYKQ